jgi:hypothetical protein
MKRSSAKLIIQVKVGTKKRNKKVTLRTILNGRFLESDWLRKNRLLLLMIFGLSLFNISVRYKSEKVIREISTMQDLVKELRSESIAVTAELMKMSKPSEVIERVKNSGMGLDVSKEPPGKLYVGE